MANEALVDVDFIRQPQSNPEDNGTPKTKFSCDQRPSGYYADLETGCQVYHMCDGIGRQFSYSCPNATLFQQRMLICDHWYMVNCSKSEVDYTANLLIGQRDKPFVEDSDEYLYDRTPRSDLLTNPKAPQYRSGRSQFGSNMNVVGIENDQSSTASNQSSYSVPSHWFTELAKVSSNQEQKEKQYYVKRNKIAQLDDNSNKKNLIDNYKTKVKNVFNQDTKFVDIQKKVTDNLTTSSSYVYNKTLPINNNINTITKSNDFPAVQFGFQRRTSTTSEPQNIVKLLQPPQEFDSKQEDSHTQTAKPTNKDFKAKIEPSSNQKRKDSEEHWKSLQRLFLIPDYEFPLDSIFRPGYENGQSSFQASRALPEYRKTK